MRAIRWCRPGTALGAFLIPLAAFSGCGSRGGDDSGGSGLTASFVGDMTPACPGAGDSLTLRKASSMGRTVAVGLQVTDCNSSLGIFGVVFDITFDPMIMQCSGSNPCSAGSVLTPPLLTSSPQCSCDNMSGEILGVFSKVAPGTNDTIVPGGSRDIVEFTMIVTRAGQGRVDLQTTGSINGTALVALDPNAPANPPAVIPGLVYAGGTVIGQ